MKCKEHSLHIAHTLRRVAQNASDQLVANRLNALAENYELRAEEVKSAGRAPQSLHATPSPRAQ